ncbi:MAG: hypothetical protein IPL52_08710 [Flavobacteriales bacterium]|nr:hypothetical protein [Flavobacteriales bacterium]
MFAYLAAFPMNFHRAGLAILFPLFATSVTLAQSDIFQILRGNKVLGRIDAQRVVKGDRVSYSMISHSAFNLVWDQEVRTVARTTYIAGHVSDCLTTVHVNKGLRDSSVLRTVAGRGLYVVHPRTVYSADLPQNPWTTARMYYEEPLGQDSIFVESELKDCAVVRIAPGEYILKLPNREKNHYVYRNGRLYEIRVDRGWLELVFRRVG